MTRRSASVPIAEAVREIRLQAPATSNEITVDQARRWAVTATKCC